MNRDRNLSVLMQEAHHVQALARAVLIKIGYPTQLIPEFYTADTFWPPLLQTLDGRVEGGTLKLLKATLEIYPGYAAEIGLSAALTEPPVAIWLTSGPATQGTAADLQRDGTEAGSALGGASPPLPPPAFLRDGAPPGPTECPTLTLGGTDLAEEFLAVTRDLLGTGIELLYVARQQSALRIPDPGDQDETIRRKVQDEMRIRAPSCTVSYRMFAFQPYLYKTLKVYGPDTTGYELDSVPATSTPEDIAAAIVLETYEANSVAKAGLVRAVVDHESSETGRRLDPYMTLHEGGVRDGDRLRVASEAIAGSLSPVVRMEALLRAVGQIRGYAARKPGNFTIIGYDDEELPGRVTVQITSAGLAPPAGLERLTAGTGQDSLDGLRPEQVSTHRISLHFPAMFPLVAPDVVWETPIFHPNIRRIPETGVRAGTLQLHPGLLGFRPEHDLAHICRMLAEVARYQDYDLTEGPGSPDPVAALWAATPAGQGRIRDIGGRPLADVIRDRDRRARPHRLFWLKPLEKEPHGHRS